MITKESFIDQVHDALDELGALIAADAFGLAKENWCAKKNLCMACFKPLCGACGECHNWSCRRFITRLPREEAHDNETH